MKFYRILDFPGGPLLVALFVALLLLEGLYPLRSRTLPRWPRVFQNAAVSAAALVLMRLALIPGEMWAAHTARESRFGVANLLPGPAVAQAVVAFLLLDYTLYIWHRLTHRVPFLWRFHDVHHTDLDLDASTALRFHFGEMGLSAVYRSAGVALVGASPALVLIYEVVFEAATAFHHSNWRLSPPVERVLNLLIVTPRMHGIHHSVVRSETDSNWSTIFSWWDRLHRTYRMDVPQDSVTIGLPAYREPAELTVFELLSMPFRRQRPAWEPPDDLPG